MAIADDFNITSAGNIRANATFDPALHTRYTLLELHAWLQDLADNTAISGDDEVYAYTKNPSQIAGLRNATRPTALTLLNGFNVDAEAAKWLNFGSVEQAVGSSLYTGLRVIGTMEVDSPIYVIQNDTKLTKTWVDSEYNTFRILVDAATHTSVTAYSREYGQTYSHFDTDLSAGSEQVAALSTADDANVDPAEVTPTIAAGYFSTTIGGTNAGTPQIGISYGSSFHDLGDANGSKEYMGTITLDGSITLTHAYQALMWACSESSSITFNTIPGFRYRVLPGQSYGENIAAPFGTFAGGKWFVAQGWFVTGIQGADSKNYELTSHDGTSGIKPPESIQIDIGNLEIDDYVVCARDSNPAGYFATDEYTVSGTLGAGTVTVTGLKPDTPASGVIRIDGDRYEYSSWSGTKVTLTGTLSKTYTNVDAFIPFIDAASAGATISSATMQFDANFTARYYVRRGTNGPIQPFESTLAVTNAGGSGTAVRNADA